jgi:type IV secretory pathway TrbD component
MNVCKSCGEINLTDGPCSKCEFVEIDQNAELTSEPPKGFVEPRIGSGGQTALGCLSGIGFAILAFIFTFWVADNFDLAIYGVVFCIIVFAYILYKAFKSGYESFGAAMAIVGGFLLLIVATCAGMV